MIVTDKEYYMDNKLIEKLDLMCDRCSGKSKLDNLLITDGDEGTGKSTLSAVIGYYVAWKLKRPFTEKNFFFDIDKLIEFAVNNSEQVIIWDEAALGGMASQWSSQFQKKLIQLLMTARKKKHFFIFNIPRVFKLNEYIIVDRAIGLAHTYSRDGKQLGRFVYFKNKALEKLFFDWKRTKRRNYKKNYNIRGTFPDMLSKLIDEDAYDLRKDEAIKSIIKEKEKKIPPLHQRWLRQRNMILKYVYMTGAMNQVELFRWFEKNKEDMPRTTIKDALQSVMVTI